MSYFKPIFVISDIGSLFHITLMLRIILLLISLVSCSIPNKLIPIPQNRILDYGLLSTLPNKAISYQQRIKPILGSRCVVCHGCYDAPCQLKLSSIEGIQRGVSKQAVYNPLRLKHAQPSRLFIDAHNTSQWRQKGFFPILNETNTENINSAEENLKNSLMYHMLNLKQAHPQPRVGKLNSDLNLKLDGKQECSTLGEFTDFSNKHPDWGMPYGLPNLSDNEYNILVQWIAQGSPVETTKPLDKNISDQINTWEIFLNNSELKNQLASRYIYEHIYLSHLYFIKQEFTKQEFSKQKVENAQPAFFRLVRSSTAPGQEIKEITTTRPYDSPGKSPFYYRFKQDLSQTVIKNHKIYALSDKKLKRFKQLFIEPNYQVTQLPSYEPAIASNPFIVFKDIPPVSRYRFLLDDAHFFIEGFIKGPVCRGQISLNVIEDYFWVTFINPDLNVATLNADFLNQNAKYFQLPADKEDTLNILSIKTRYWKNQKKYIRSKIENFKHFQKIPINQAMRYLYNGEQTQKDGNNSAAALTIFRHFDSASVSYGLLDYSAKGQGPETSMVVDYPIFERIHYLLVAGFNVFGNLGHQLNTRIYMEFLRMEGEDNFLAFLPVSARKNIRDEWYKGIRKTVTKYFKAPLDWLSVQSVTGYTTDHPKQELYQKLKKHFQSTQALAYKKNHGLQKANEGSEQIKYQKIINQFMDKVNSLSGEKLQTIPDITFLRIKMKQSTNHRAFTIINNKAYKHLNSLFEDEKKNDKRDYKYDRLMIVDWLEGSYPNFFLDVNIEDLEQFVSQFKAISNDKDYEEFISLYGVRRTSSKFWELSDWFYQYYKDSHPIKAGYFDLNRYENR
jgi:Fatty acid cis/trans isomerase (CTI)